MDEIENCGKVYWKNFGSPWEQLSFGRARGDEIGTHSLL